MNRYHQQQQFQQQFYHLFPAQQQPHQTIKEEVEGGVAIMTSKDQHYQQQHQPNQRQSSKTQQEPQHHSDKSTAATNKELLLASFRKAVFGGTTTPSREGNGSNEELAVSTTPHGFSLSSSPSPVTAIEQTTDEVNVVTTPSSPSSSTATTAATATSSAAKTSAYTIRQSFPEKLMVLLSNDTVSECITWLPNGRSFVVLQPDKLAHHILPMYFYHNNNNNNSSDGSSKSSADKRSSSTRRSPLFKSYTSFIKTLLNVWGFKRATSGHDHHDAFYHQSFQRDTPSLCLDMHKLPKKMKNNKKKMVAVEQSPLHNNTSVPLKKRFKSQSAAATSYTPPTKKMMHVILPDSNDKPVGRSNTGGNGDAPGATADGTISISEDDSGSSGCNYPSLSYNYSISNKASRKSTTTTTTLRQPRRPAPIAPAAAATMANYIPPMIPPNLIIGNGGTSTVCTITAYTGATTNALTHAAIQNILIAKQQAATVAAAALASTATATTNSTNVQLNMDSNLVSKALERRDKEELLRANYSMLHDAYKKAVVQRQQR